MDSAASAITKAVITRDGRIMPKNSAHNEGEQDPTHLIKDRVWG